MDFRAAYASLTELFPQVDARVLKAAAFEHCNDVNAAVEFILYEVLPSISVPCETHSTVHSALEVSNEVHLKEQDANNRGSKAAQPEFISWKTDISDDPTGSQSPCSGKDNETIINVDAIIDVEADDHYCLTAVSGDAVSSTSPSSGKAEETIIDVESDDLYSSVSVVTEHRDFSWYNSLPEDIERSKSECEEQSSRCSVDCAGMVSTALESTHNISSVDERSMVSMTFTADAPKHVVHVLDEGEEYHSRSLAEYHSEQLTCDTEMVSLGERDSPMLLTTQSGHGVSIDLLEDCVTDAKNNKKTLVTAVQSVVDMMKEAEHLEQRAKLAKEESSSAGQDILNKAEELKKMLQHANQANDMHAGEVYGEKSILSTEARELQTRLLNLSDERNKSFSIIEEIQKALEARIAAAKADIAAAEQEKLEKEDLARNALKEEECNMDTIVQESKKLQKEAEENAKLREFLVDRGRVVDTLQGEIAVICEDILLLKSRVDDRAPLKGILSTYSSASSSSSFTRNSVTSSGQIESLRSGEGENVITGKQKVASDDDWELFLLEA